MRRTGKHLRLDDVPRYEALLEAVKKAWRDVQRGKYRLRDLALVSILVFTGCRLREALELTAKDLDFRSRTIRINQEKKGREYVRLVPIPSELFWRIAREYIDSLAFRDAKLFNITDRQARNIVYGFTGRYLGRRLRPHAIRHAYATFVLKKTKDLEAVRRLLGHSDYKWLKCYLDYTQEDLEEELARAFSEVL